MTTKVTVTYANDDPTSRVVEFDSEEKAQEFVNKTNGLYESRTGSSILSEITTIDKIDDVDEWIEDNLTVDGYAHVVRAFERGTPKQ